MIYETVGLWIEMGPDLPGAFSEHGHHFMGGIHAAEHAMIHLFPLQAICDSGDVGGISYTGHPQLQGPAVFLYDGMPGGAGLTEQAFRGLTDLLRRTRDHVSGCDCEDGCPGCTQSSRCGNGNKPLDKAAAIDVLELWIGDQALERWGCEPPRDTRGEPLPTYAAVAPPPMQGRQGVRPRG